MTSSEQIETDVVETSTELENIKNDIKRTEERLRNLEVTVHRILELSIKKESTVELTVASLLQESFNSLSTHLKTSINKAKHELMAKNTGLSIAVVDGVNEKLTEDSITVIKNEDGYVFNDVHGNVCNHGSLKYLNEYFDKRPGLFEVDSQVIVNIYHQETR